MPALDDDTAKELFAKSFKARNPYLGSIPQSDHGEPKRLHHPRTRKETPVTSRVWLRRAYDDPTRNDGRRVLVDRIWPRGVPRDDADIDHWCPEVAPSDELRKWFGHDPERWEEFQQRYRDELHNRSEQVDQLVGWAREGRITLVYGAKDTAHNNAIVLRQVVEERRTST